MRTNNDNKNEEQSQTEERDDDEKSTLFLSVVCVSRNSFVDFSEKIILRRKLVRTLLRRRENIVTFRAHETEKSVEHFSSYSKREREKEAFRRRRRRERSRSLKLLSLYAQLSIARGFEKKKKYYLKKKKKNWKESSKWQI